MIRSFRYSLLCLLFAGSISFSFAQKPKYEIPAVFSGISFDGNGNLIFDYGKGPNPEKVSILPLNLQTMRGNPQGTETGLAFDFGLKGLNGWLYYGFVPYGDSKHPHPVYFNTPSRIDSGKAFVNIKDKLSGRYDMIGWEKNGKGTLGYRVTTDYGSLLYDGLITFKGTGPFEIDVTLVEGPTVNKVTPESAVITFETNFPEKAIVLVNGVEYKEKGKNTWHEILVDALQPNTSYDYTVKYGENEQSYQFKTAPLPGSRTAFTFAYASDSRSGIGGGERDLYGANFYIMKKILALAKSQDVAFMQFTGDLINGYLSDPAAIELQYANWKRAVEPFAHYFPVYVGMGNHEALGRGFEIEGLPSELLVDRFPFDTESAEAIFAKNFTLPENGLESEDGASYDPNPEQQDFPPYKESVYYYTYDNVAVIVLNSDYWYTRFPTLIPRVSGNLHGYIMDQQMAWLEQTLATLEADNHIDHIFLSLHTPFFPNGGHVQDDMWYNGDNQKRPFVAGKPLKNGIIQRRNQLLELLVNQSQKTVALLTGDEHNYAVTTLDSTVNIHPEMYFGEKVILSRTIYQVNNGAAGAPYYAQEETPWSPAVSGFTTQNALVLFHVDGNRIEMVVLNPDTLEEVDRKTLRE